MIIPQSEYYSDVTHNFCVTSASRKISFNMKSFHYHNVYEIYYFISGERRLFFRDRIYHITAGDIVIIKKYELHSISDWNKPGHSRIMIDFKDDFISEFNIEKYNILQCFDNDVIVFSPKNIDNERLYNKFTNILEEYSNKSPEQLISLKVQLIDLLILISRMQKKYGDKTEPSTEKQIIIEQVMKYINENYNKKISLCDISEFIGYSKNYLCSYFKKNSGFSIIEYLNSIRVKKSQEYLSTTKLSITEISMNCGFESITHFGRVFKEITGLSPMQYRKLK